MDAVKDVIKQEYRGFTIVVTPVKDNDDLWDFEYRIERDSTPLAQRAAAGVTRSQTLGGHATAEVAHMAGMEVAKIEVDNLLALDEK